MSNGIFIRWIQTEHQHIVDMMKQSSHHYIDEETGEIVLNEYHLEDDIWSHTCMVVKLTEMLEAPDNVIIAALLHDVGKPYARFNNNETKRARFIGHEGVSFFTAVNLALEITKTKKDAEEVLRLIAMHSVIFDHFRDGVNEKSIKKLANKFSTDDTVFFENLCLHVNADNEGRFFNDNKSFDEWIAPHFNSEFFTNFSIKKPYCGQPTLYFLIGPQMSGKTEFSKKIKGVVLSRNEFSKQYCDEFKCEQSQLTEEDEKAIEDRYEHAFSELLKTEASIILDRPNMNRSTRLKFTSKASNYYKKAFIMATDITTLFKRGEEKSISRDEIINKCKKFSFPNADEVDEVEFIF